MALPTRKCTVASRRKSHSDTLQIFESGFRRTDASLGAGSRSDDDRSRWNHGGISCNWRVPRDNRDGRGGTRSRFGWQRDCYEAHSETRRSAKKTVEKDPQLWNDLEKLIEPVTRGDPESPLRWTCKSTRRLAGELNNMGHQVSHRIVAELLSEHEYSLQANQKTTEGESDPDRNEQFEYINAKAEEFLAAGQPVISVDTKKKSWSDHLGNGGRELRPKGEPEKVMVHDFPLQDLGRVSPYGVYDVYNNEGWVSVGTDHDTAGFAVASIRRWWYSMGQLKYPNPSRLLITADGGGSNGSRVRLWKLELQDLANELEIPISVCHLPPGTSKWNKIEHRLFSFISQNWRGKPLVSHEAIVQLIRSTTTKKGLRVKSFLDVGRYPAWAKSDG